MPQDTMSTASSTLPAPSAGPEHEEHLEDGGGIFAPHWSVQRVAMWVSSTLGFPKYADIFQAHAIDGRQLCILTQQHFNLFDFLGDTLQITSWGHRNKSAAAISALVVDQPTLVAETAKAAAEPMPVPAPPKLTAEVKAATE